MSSRVAFGSSTQLQTVCGISVAQMVKNLSAMQVDPGSISGLERFPGEGNGNPLQYSCLENPMGGGAWQAVVHGVARVGHDLATKPPPK